MFEVDLVRIFDDGPVPGPWPLPLPAALSGDWPDAAAKPVEFQPATMVVVALIGGVLGLLTRRPAPVHRNAYAARRGNGQSGRLHAVALPAGT